MLRSTLILFLAFSPCFLLAEEDDFSLPTRGRRRIRRYEVKPLPAGDPKAWRLTTGESEDDKKPEISRDVDSGIRVSRARQYGFSGINMIPMMGAMSEEDEEDDEEEDSSSQNWFSAMDFLTEEEKLVSDTELDEEPLATDMSEDVTDWSNLSEAIMGDPEDEASEDEEPERPVETQSSQTRLDEAAASSGLGLSSVLENESGSGEDANRFEGDGPRVNQASASAVAPALRMDLMRAVSDDRFSAAQDRETSEPQKTGSQQMFDEIRNRWQPGETERGSVAGGTSRPSMGEGARLSNPQPRPELSSAVRRLPSIQNDPVIKSPILSSPVRSSQIQAPRPNQPQPASPGIGPGGFQRDDGRVRSLLDFP